MSADAGGPFASPLEFGGPWRPQPPRRVGVVLALPLIVFVAALVVYPLANVIGDSFDGGTLDRYRIFFNKRRYTKALTTTLRVSIIVTVTAAVLGGSVAWVLRNTGSRLVRITLWAAAAVPFCMGTVTKNYTFQFMLGRQGVINDVLQFLRITDAPVELLYTDLAVVLGMVYTMLPFAVAPLYVAFASVDLDLLHAAQSLGASRTRALLTVLLPLSRAGIFATLTILFVISIGFYITPVLLGGADSPFIATLIQSDIFTKFDYSAAATSSAIVLALALIVLAIAYRLVGREPLERAVG